MGVSDKYLRNLLPDVVGLLESSEIEILAGKEMHKNQEIDVAFYQNGIPSGLIPCILRILKRCLFFSHLQLI